MGGVAEVAAQVALWVEVAEQDAVAGCRIKGTEVGDGRGLTHSPLPVGEAERKRAKPSMSTYGGHVASLVIRGW